MAALPKDAKDKFDQAARNLNNDGRGVPGVNEAMVANATAMAAMANISVAEGLAMAVLEAESRLTTALTGFASAIELTSRQQAAVAESIELASKQQAIIAEKINQAELRLVRWTVIQGWLAGALTFFTLVQVVVAILEYLK
jgi:hypothetical protein